LKKATIGHVPGSNSVRPAEVSYRWKAEERRATAAPDLARFEHWLELPKVERCPWDRWTVGTVWNGNHTASARVLYAGIQASPV
jgi:hypothetical protein